MGKGRLISACAAAMLCMSMQLSAAAADVRLEQLQCVMPDIHVYVHADEALELGNVQAYLDGVRLEDPQVTRFDRSGEVLHYYILLDDTGSVPRDYVQPVKDAMYALGDVIRPTDELTIFTIGDRAEMIYNATGITEDYAEAVERYSRAGQETFLYEALSQIAEHTEIETIDSPKRNVLIAVSDGFNESVGVSVYDEAVAKLQAADIPLYGVGMGSSQEGLDCFGRLARSTDGTMTLASAAEITEIIPQIAKSLQEDYVISVQAPDNRIGGEHKLMLKLPDYQLTQTLNFQPKRWTPDRTIPEVLEVVRRSDHEVEVVFSEDIMGADDVTNYALLYMDNILPLTKVTYTNGDRCVAVLETSSMLYCGEYTLNFEHMTDISQELNVLPGGYQLVMDGPLVTENKFEWIWKLMWIAIPGMLLLILFAILVSVLKKNKGEGELSAAGINAAAMAVGGGVPCHLRISMQNADGVVTEQEADLHATLIVGRSRKCDVVLSDATISRRHFRLIRSDGNVMIVDCGSTSGTMINGVLLQGEQPLPNGAVIRAGVTEITIRW